MKTMLAGGCYLEQKDVEKMMGDNVDFRQLNFRNYLYISTCSSFFTANHSLQLVPVKNLQQQIQALYSTFGRYVVGVHIRRTDNRYSIQGSPTSAFISRMQIEQQINPDAVFFLATDDPEEEQILKLHFPGKIITYRKKCLCRREPTAICDALIDLYCLSKTKKIIGSYWSSFSEQAALLGGCELIIAQDSVKI